MFFVFFSSFEKKLRKKNPKHFSQRTLDTSSCYQTFLKYLLGIYNPVQVHVISDMKGGFALANHERKQIKVIIRLLYVGHPRSNVRGKPIQTLESVRPGSRFCCSATNWLWDRRLITFFSWIQFPHLQSEEVKVCR